MIYIKNSTRESGGEEGGFRSRRGGVELSTAGHSTLEKLRRDDGSRHPGVLSATQGNFQGRSMEATARSCSFSLVQRRSFPWQIGEPVHRNHPLVNILRCGFENNRVAPHILEALTILPAGLDRGFAVEPSEWLLPSLSHFVPCEKLHAAGSNSTACSLQPRGLVPSLDHLQPA